MENAKIMIVEDEKIVARDIKNRLKKLGYNVLDIVSSGKEAIWKAEETNPDLVLMDIVLKGDIDGIEAAKQIRNRFNIPVIYLTAYSDDGAIERAKLTEPSGYIIKPFQIRELRSSIEIALYNHEMEKNLRRENHWLSRTLETIGDCVIITDSNGLVTFINPATEALTGWNKEEVSGKYLGGTFKIKSEEMDTETLLKEILQEGVFINLISTTIFAKDGTEKLIDISAAPIRDDRESINGAVLLCSDFAKRRTVEAKTPDNQKPQLSFVRAREDTPITLMLASSTLVLEGIRKILEPVEEIKITAESSNRQELLSIIQRKKPQVLFIDTAIPNLDTLEALESIKDMSPDIKVILLLHNLDEDFIINAISLGVQGFLTSTSNGEQFVQAIKTVRNNEIWLDIKNLTNIITRLVPTRDNLKLLKSNLTNREEEIVKLVVQGLSNKQISKKLLISENTVKNHLTNIFNKVGISNRSQLINLIGKNGT